MQGDLILTAGATVVHHLPSTPSTERDLLLDRQLVGTMPTRCKRSFSQLYSFLVQKPVQFSDPELQLLFNNK